MSSDKTKSKSKTWQLELANKNMKLEIDARKQIERILKEREDRFKTIFYQAPVAYFLNDLNGNFTDGNREAYHLTGYTKEELFGKNFIELNLIDKKDQKAILELINRSAQGEYTGPDEFSLTKKDGSIVIIEISSSPVTINDKKLVLGVAHDVTERKLIQVELQKSEERYRKLFDSAKDALMALHPPMWQFTSGNPAILEMFKVKSIEEFLTYGPWDVSPEKQPDGRLSSEKAQEMIKIAMTKGSNFFEWTHKRLNGKSFSATVLLTKIQLKDEIFLQATVRDITDSKKAEETLKKSESLLKYIFDSTGDGLLVVDDNGRITHRNTEFIKMWKIPAKLSNSSDDSKLLDFVLSQLSEPKQFLSKVKQLYNSTKTDHDILHFKDGRIFERNSQPLIVDNTIAGRVWSFRDITNRKRIEEALKSSEERLKILFESAPDAYYLSDLKGTFIDGNKTAVDLLGYKKEELIGKSFLKLKLLSAKELLKASKLLMKNAQGKGTGPAEFLLNRKDGTQIPVEISTYPVKIKNKIVVLGIARDITERKQNEDILKIQSQKLADILEGTNAGTWDWNIQTGEVTFSERWAEIIGYTLDELEPTDINTWINNVHPDDLPYANALLEKHFSRELDYYDVVFRQPHKDGRWIWVNARGKVIEWTEDRKPLRMSGTHLDITKHKQAEEALRESEENYRTLTENIPLGIYRNTSGAKGKFLEVNKALVDMFGFKDRESMLASSVSSLYVSPSKRKKLSDKFKTKNSIKNEELRLLRQDGSTFIGSTTARAVKDEKGNIIHYDGIIEDISERLQLRTQLLESREKFRSLINNSPDIILMVDIHGVITYVNKEYSNQKPIDILGQTIYDLIPPDFQEIARSTIEKVFKTGKSFSFENLALSTEDTVVWYKNNIGPIIKNGKVKATTIIARDISEQKQIEIMQNEFIASVSHELRTPLTIIRESLSLLSDGIFGKLNKDQLDIVNPSMEDVDRLSRIINNLLDISRIEGQKIKLECEMVDIVKLAQGTVSSFGYKVASKNIELVFTSNRKSIKLYLDRERIIQVFMNLIGNAIKFTEKGKIEVFITEKANDVECCIADTGRGIDQKDLGTLFDRFHQVGKVMRAGEKGTGLGLSISKGIIKLHKGRIWVDSKINKGSKFCFALPKYSTDAIIIENIEENINIAASKHTKRSLLLIRLNNYSEIESKFGVDEAKKVTKLMLQIIQEELTSGEFSFIKEKDEVILFSDITKQNITVLLSKLEDMLAKSILKIDKDLTVDLSYGYSLYPDNGDNASALIKDVKKVLLKNDKA